MSATPNPSDGELIQQYVRDLQVLAGRLTADVHLAEELLVDAVSRLSSPSCPAGHWTVRGLTVTALTQMAGTRRQVLEDWDARVQQVWLAASMGELQHAVMGVVTTLRACKESTVPRHRQAAAALDYMRTHLHEPSLSLDAVSATVRLSRWHLSRLLRRETGATYRELVQQLRLERACGLLRDPLISVKEVAAEVGYRYSTELNRDFRRAFGVCPTRWRHRVTPPSAPGLL